MVTRIVVIASKSETVVRCVIGLTKNYLVILYAQTRSRRERLASMLSIPGRTSLAL